jgi:hypothetical protein
MTFEEFERQRKTGTGMFDKNAQTELSTIKVKLLKPLSVGGVVGRFGAGTILDAFVPVNDKNPKIVTLITAGGTPKELVVGTDVELLGKIEPPIEPPVEPNAKKTTSNSNLILIGAIVLIAYFLIKK